MGLFSILNNLQRKEKYGPHMPGQEPISVPKMPIGSYLTSLGQGLLSASGPSRMPVSLGQALGEGAKAVGEEEQNFQEKALKNAMLGIELKKYQLGTDRPSDIQSYEYFKGLAPEERDNFLRVKRAQQILNLGGTQAILDPMGGFREEYPVTPKPEDMPEFRREQKQEEAIGSKIGDSTGGAITNLGKAQNDAAYSLKLLDELVGNQEKGVPEHPGFRYAVGKSSLMPILPGTNPASFVNRLKQVEGQQFLQAFENLKGGGHITEIEGQKATDAIARMQRSNTEEEFVNAVNDLRGVIQTGLQRSQKKASGDLYQSPQNDIGLQNISNDELLRMLNGQ